jgi:peptidyl-tRNA hydrolase, PTH2 family
METKQVIVIRKDLKMRRGKEIAQACHASIAFLTRQLQLSNKCKLSAAAKEWIESGFTKICLCVNNEQELLDIYNQAKNAMLETHLIIDSGKTEFNGVPTKTCISIGPDEASRIDAITKNLTLY